MNKLELYAILDREVLEFGLTFEQTQTRVGIKRNLVKYKRTVKPRFISEIELCEEIAPIQDEDGEWYQQWAIVQLDINEAKKKVLSYYSLETHNEIISKYSELKQRSDLVDIEYAKITLMIDNESYTSDIIKKIALTKSTEFTNNDIPLDLLVEDFLELERDNWKQIIKSYIRGSWLIKCKKAHNKKLEIINNSKNYIELKNNFTKIDYPPFPLQQIPSIIPERLSIFKKFGL